MHTLEKDFLFYIQKVYLTELTNEKCTFEGDITMGKFSVISTCLGGISQLNI